MDGEFAMWSRKVHHSTRPNVGTFKSGDEHIEISLLIDADHYWNLIGDHII